MFGSGDVNSKPSHDVINISDTTELIVINDSPVLKAASYEFHVASPADPDEVNSPFFAPATRIRRKLFDEASTSTEPSTPPMAGGVVGSKAPNRFPVMALYSSPKGSSCASWSPAAPPRNAAT